MIHLGVSWQFFLLKIKFLYVIIEICLHLNYTNTIKLEYELIFVPHPFTFFSSLRFTVLTQA